MELIVYIIVAIIVGGAIGWLLANTKGNAILQTEKENAQTKYNDLEKKWVAFEASTINQLKTANDNLLEKQNELNEFKQNLQESALTISSLNSQISTANADLRACNQTVNDKNKEIGDIKSELKISKDEFTKCNQSLATAKANNEALTERLERQKTEIEDLGKKFNLEFENIANKILETKTAKFTELNKTNLNLILEPLGKNINEFKRQVDDVYKAESKERFSLGEKVKELAALNKVISEEAHNLTKALKGEAKTQGDWGQMILESILERSGLVKDREYFMEVQLMDNDGNPLRSDSEGKKMRPDAIIKYPDNRNVIIDSKVSLNAFTRLVASVDIDEQKQELAAHVAAIKNHIVSLSAKGYDDYDKALDFVMMFVPSEPAYIAALQGEADLWNYAYDRRILLLSPTNLITCLKLIVDLWKREYQNRNAQQIAERGAKLYDKFVGFIDSLEDVGVHLEKAQNKYGEAFKQLSTGNDNLVIQATKLKDLGLKTKKQLSNGLVENAIVYDLLPQSSDDGEIVQSSL